jgi:hypothetical protein
MGLWCSLACLLVLLHKLDLNQHLFFMKVHCIAHHTNNLSQGWSTFGARTSHRRPWTHKTHHGLDSGEATTFPHIVYSAPLRRSEWHPNGFLSRDSQMGVPKSARLGVPPLCATMTSRVDLRSERGLNQSCSSRRELSNDVLHATCTQGNRVDSRLFAVGSQIASLTPNLSFGHNLCCICPNGSWKPILDIYTPISFQWYKELLKARGFDLCNCSLKFWESTETPTLKMGVHLEVWVFILTLSHTPRHFSWPALLQTLALVVSPRLGLRHTWQSCQDSWNQRFETSL